MSGGVLSVGALAFMRGRSASALRKAVAFKNALQRWAVWDLGVSAFESDQNLKHQLQRKRLGQQPSFPYTCEFSIERSWRIVSAAASGACERRKPWHRQGNCDGTRAGRGARGHFLPLE